MNTQETIYGRQYFVINGWMVNRLGLRGDELIAYAFIYTMTQCIEECIVDTRTLSGYLSLKYSARVLELLDKLKNKRFIDYRVEDMKVIANIL